MTRLNPDTGILEERTDISTIICDRNSVELENVINAFETDKICGYQYLHIAPEENQGIEITTNSNPIRPRTNYRQELWMLNVKNPDNPRLRDSYTLVLDDGENVREGKIFVITSIRPDLKYSARIDRLSAMSYWDSPVKLENKKFIIEGTVDDVIADSCYNIYMDNLGSAISERSLIARVPVIDKKFHFEIEIDTVKNGRLRAIFPGEKLCSAWIDLKFIPGFTMDLSVHNGWYSIKNQKEYNQMLSAHNNKQLFDIVKRNSSKGIDICFPVKNDSQKDKQIQSALAAYQVMLDNINRQIEEIRYVYDEATDKSHLKELYKQSREITKSMKKLIDRYARINNESQE